jgi:hypothetical protein
MNDVDNPSPAERQLDEYLESLRRQPPRSSSGLPAHIIRRARWQRAIRAPLHVVGTLLGALADGVAILSGTGREGRR